MSEIKEGMPLLARHEGEWKGVYTYIDPDGNIIDKHKSHLSCTFPEEGEYDYVQINRYEWEDGKKEERIFPAVYRGLLSVFFSMLQYLECSYLCTCQACPFLCPKL